MAITKEKIEPLTMPKRLGFARIAIKPTDMRHQGITTCVSGLRTRDKIDYPRSEDPGIGDCIHLAGCFDLRFPGGHPVGLSGVEGPTTETQLQTTRAVDIVTIATERPAGPRNVPDYPLVRRTLKRPIRPLQPVILR